MRARSVLAGMRRLPRMIIDSMVGLCSSCGRRAGAVGVVQLRVLLGLFPGLGRAAGPPGEFPTEVVPEASVRAASFPQAFAEAEWLFLWRAADSAFFDPAGGSAPWSKEATTESVPGRELPADTASLEVQAHTISSFSRESDPPLAHAKTKTIRCRDPARSWPEIFLHQKAFRPSRRFQLPRSRAYGLSA